MSAIGCDPMIPVSGPNFVIHSNGVPNHPNYYICGCNEQSIATTYVCSTDTGAILGAASGQHSGPAQFCQGSVKYFIQGSPATRLGDAGITNGGNMVCFHCAPCQTKCLINA